MTLVDDPYTGCPLDAAGLAALARLVRRGKLSRLDGPEREVLRTQLAQSSGPVYVGLRAGGRLRAHVWSEASGGRSWLQLLTTALRRLKDTGAAGSDGEGTVEIALGHTRRQLAPHESKQDRNFLYANARRGLLAIEVARGRKGKEILGRWSPFDVLAANRNPRKLLENLLASKGIRDAAGVRVRAWQTHQLLVPRGGDDPATPVFRGTRIVLPRALERASVERLARLHGSWLVGHVDERGRMTYKQDPALGEDLEQDNNMIRQWMATCAMNRYGHYLGGDEGAAVHEVTARNIRHNLGKFFATEPNPRGGEPLGLIQYLDHVKLGAIALAALALHEHPQRAEFAEAERGLERTVEYLWSTRGDGQFQTFYRPVYFDHALNFYPGEALLYWSFLYRETRDPALLERIMKSFRWHREYHLGARKPSFVPWQTQASYIVWKVTGDDWLRDFIFEMNDWLLPVQRVRARYPDAAGQFYDPKNPDYGTPHSSSTGVYMEGLIDAYALARELGDDARREAYRESLVRGIRNIMQMTFLDELEAWYGFDPTRVVGGVRTAIYSNRVRCDNVQHNLMGILKVLQRFPDEDFEHPVGSLTLA